MNSNTRLIVNTLAQHIKTVINIVLSLYSTRLVLQALGQSDFGIFSLVGGLVTMLGFITNAMIVATQRHLSFYNGKGSAKEIQQIFSNSLFLHIIIGVAISVIIIILQPLFFNGFLRIDSTRTTEAIFVYMMMTLGLLFTFISAPYKALFVAHENIVYISLIDIMDGVLKLICALWLLQWQHDRLVAYGVIMASIMAFNYLAFSINAKINYKETVLIPNYKQINSKNIFDIFNIAGWTIYMTGCIMGRTQGIAIVFNHFFGTLINTAYGIAMQVTGAVHFVGTAVTNAISPRIYKAEGMNNRDRMLSMSEAASKFSYLLMAMAVIPIVFEMDNILHTWLGEVPEKATLICQFVLITALLDQSTTGLTIANLAVGNIRNYSIITNTIKLSTVILVYINLYWGGNITLSMICYMVIEIISALIRLPLLKATTGLSIQHYTTNVFLRLLIPSLALTCVSWTSIQLFDFPFRFLFTITLSSIISAPFIWFGGLKVEERNTILDIIGIKKKKF